MGKGRALLPREAVDESIVYRPERCQHCGEVLTGEDPAPYRLSSDRIQVALSRSHAVAQALPGANYAGVVGSDRAGRYAWLAVEQR